MSTQTTPGILINRLPFGNTSLIISWMTPTSGLVKTLAKGVLRPNHPLSTSLDLFYWCEITFRQRPGSELGLLTDLRLLHPFLPLRRDWTVILCAQYFTELLTQLTEPGTPIADFFDIYLRGLRYLEDHLPTVQLVQRYETKLLQLSGLPSAVPQALDRALSALHHSIPPTRAQLLRALAPASVPSPRSRIDQNQ